MEDGDQTKKESENKTSKDPNYPYGKVLLSLEIFPEKLAQGCKVGKGREEPNINPYLPPPVGRMKFSWNPYTLIVIYFLIFLYQTNKCLIFLVSIHSSTLEKKNMHFLLLYTMHCLFNICCTLHYPTSYRRGRQSFQLY